MSKLVGKVTEQERDYIQNLFERKNGLIELVQIITVEKEELYEKVIKDLGQTNTAFHQWWSDMGKKYQWESKENGQWSIDFETCEIYLCD